MSKDEIVSEMYSGFKEGKEDQMKKCDQVSLWQQNACFDMMLGITDISQRSNILDIGCGIGNNTAKLAKSLSDNKSKVVGIDIIKERIDIAKDIYQTIPNLEFHYGFAEDAFQFGSNFDLIISSLCLQWITPGKREQAMKSIYQCLANDSEFIFNMEKYDALKLLGNTQLNHVQRNYQKHEYHLMRKEEIESIVLNTGFKKCEIMEHEIFIPLPDLDYLLELFASYVMFSEDFNLLLNDMKAICEKENIPHLYDNYGHVVFRNICYFVRCTK